MVLLASMLLLTGCAAKKNSELAAAPEQETKTETQVEAQAEEPAEAQAEEPAETQAEDQTEAQAEEPTQTQTAETQAAEAQTEETQPAETVEIRTVNTDSFSMDYFCFGSGEETLVILPGLSVQSVMGFADSVAEAYRVLTDDYTIYVFDRRKELPETYSLSEMAQDTADAIRALGLDSVDLLGASQGGMMALEIAVNNPDLIQKLVITASSAHVGEEQLGTIENWIQLAGDGKREELYLAFGEAVYPQDVFEQSRDLLIEAGKSVTDRELDRFVILAESIRDFDITDDLDQITCPTLVIGSMDDQVLGAEASVQIAEHLKNQKGVVLYMYNGYGHASYDTAPDFKERVLYFLSSGKGK